MNEELQETLSAVLQKSMEIAERTGQWALDMAPQLIEQYLMWEFWSAIFFSLLGVALLFIGYKSLKTILSESGKPKDKSPLWVRDSSYQNINVYDPSAKLFVNAISATVGLIVGAIMSLTSIYTVIFISVAPEIYLIKNLL